MQKVSAAASSCQEKGKRPGSGKAREPSGLSGVALPRSGEAVEQLDPDGKRQLLTGDAIDECFEDGGKARGPEPSHARGERAEQRV